MQIRNQVNSVNYFFVNACSFYVSRISFHYSISCRSDKDHSKGNIIQMAPPVGIDLGTTFSSIAFYENGQEKIIGDRRGKRLIPSIVYFCPDTGDCFVGETAYKLSTKCPQNLLKDSKRLLGRKYDDEAVKHIISSDETCYSLVRSTDDMVAYEVKIKGTAVQRTPEEVSSQILKYLKTSAEYYFNNEPVTEAVISIPAYFSNAQRKATMKAATLAGLKVLRLITEPVAGALHYVKNGNNNSKLMVFDWGGGTLDISFIDVNDKAFEVKAVYGDTRLGGRNIDEVLFKRFFIKVTRHPEKFIRRLLGNCITLKEHLSIANKFTIPFEFYDGVNDMELSLTREQFNEMNESIFEKVTDILNYGLNDVGLKSSAITDVILVGGCTRIPKVKEILERIFGSAKLRTDLNPDEAVVMGACIQAATLKRTRGFKDLEKYRISEVTPLSIGVRVNESLMDIFIPKNSKLPTTGSKTLVTSKNDQDRVIFPIFEGERKNTKYNNELGSFRLTGLPKGRAGDVKFNVVFNLNEDGILTVTATETSTSKMNKLVLMMSEFRLNERQLKLKFNEAEKTKHEDELFEKFINRREDLIQKCYHTIYDLNKISNKDNRNKIEKNCLNFISSAKSLSFLELDRLESIFVSFRDETYQLLKNSGIMLEITY